MSTHSGDDHRQPAGVTADGGQLKLGPTPAEYVSAFYSPIIGIVVASTLLAAGAGANSIRPITFIGAGIGVLALVQAVLEVRDLPRRTIRWNRGGITLQASRLPPLALRWSELGFVQTVVQTDRLWHLFSRTRVWLQCQPLNDSTDFERRHPHRGDYLSDDDQRGSAITMLVGLGMTRAKRVDATMRHANPAYRGIRQLPTLKSPAPARRHPR